MRVAVGPFPVKDRARSVSSHQAIHRDSKLPGRFAVRHPNPPDNGKDAVENQLHRARGGPHLGPGRKEPSRLGMHVIHDAQPELDEAEAAQVLADLERIGELSREVDPP